MKTLTELSGSQVRAAAAALDEAKRSLRSEQPAPQPAAAPAVPAEVAPAADAPSSPVEAAPAADGPAADVQESAAPDAEQPAPEAQAARAPAVEVPAPVLEAVGKATGVSGDRLAMLCAAVEAAGGRVQDVRLVRVFGPEEPVAGAKTIRGHQYVVDLMPASMKQVAGSPREEGRRGGRGRGGGGGGGGSRGGGEKGTGGFSMDSLREDRKNQRGGPGRFGGPRKPGGGGRPPGGAPRGR